MRDKVAAQLPRLHIGHLLLVLLRVPSSERALRPHVRLDR